MLELGYLWARPTNSPKMNEIELGDLLVTLNFGLFITNCNATYLVNKRIFYRLFFTQIIFRCILRITEYHRVDQVNPG